MGLRTREAVGSKKFQIHGNNRLLGRNTLVSSKRLPSREAVGSKKVPTWKQGPFARVPRLLRLEDSHVEEKIAPEPWSTLFNRGLYGWGHYIKSCFAGL